MNELFFQVKIIGGVSVENSSGTKKGRVSSAFLKKIKF
jgi:hypothetical protein